MAVLGWVIALGTLWVACAWGVAVVLGRVIVRSRARRCALDPLPGPAAADPVARSRVPRRGPRVSCACTGRSTGRGHGRSGPTATRRVTHVLRPCGDFR